MNKDLEKVLDTKNEEINKKRMSRTSRAMLSGLSLAITGILCVSCVLFANASTKDIISQNESHGIKGKLKSLLPPEAKEKGVKINCYNIKTNKLIGNNQQLFVASKDLEIRGYVLTYSTSLGYSDPLVMIAGFTKDKKVYKADIKFSQETPGLGDKVDRDHGDFLDQFNDKKISEANWDVKKYGGDFDFITGSTVTSRATVISTSQALKALDTININSLSKCKVF